MEVTVDTFGPFREAVGAKSVTVTLEDGATVGDALAALVAEAPDLGDRLFDGEELAGSVVVTREGESIAHADGLETPVADSDTLRVTEQIVGG